MAIMNRSVLNRLTSERIDRDAREAAAATLGPTAAGGASNGFELALLVRARQKALRKQEAEKQEAMEVTSN
jgi:hypothetical protein